MDQDKIFKFDLLSEINGPMWFTKNLTRKVGVAYDHVTTMKFRKNTHISGMVKAMIVKFCMLLETKGRAVLSNGPGPGPRAPKTQGPQTAHALFYYVVK